MKTHESVPLGGRPLDKQFGTAVQLLAEVGSDPVSSFSTKPMGSEVKKRTVTVPKVPSAGGLNSAKETGWNPAGR